CGSYQKKFSKKSLKVHPYYIRSTVIIPASNWKNLSNEYKKLKVKYELPLKKEIKWTYLWQLRNHKKFNKIIEEHKDIYFLKDYAYHKLIDFVSESLNLLNLLESCKIIVAVTKNILNKTIDEKSILKMHLQ